MSHLLSRLRTICSYLKKTLKSCPNPSENELENWFSKVWGGADSISWLAQGTPYQRKTCGSSHTNPWWFLDSDIAISAVELHWSAVVFRLTRVTRAYHNDSDMVWERELPHLIDQKWLTGCPTVQQSSAHSSVAALLRQPERALYGIGSSS